MLTKEQSLTKQVEKTYERSIKRNELPQKTKNNKLRENSLGLSVKQVSKMGKQQSCMYCHQNIDRNEWHTVNVGYQQHLQDDIGNKEKNGSLN
jgi:hypothetical protein